MSPILKFARFLGISSKNLYLLLSVLSALIISGSIWFLVKYFKNSPEQSTKNVASKNQVRREMVSLGNFDFPKFKVAPLVKKAVISGEIISERTKIVPIIGVANRLTCFQEKMNSIIKDASESEVDVLQGVELDETDNVEDLDEFLESIEKMINCVEKPLRQEKTSLEKLVEREAFVNSEELELLRDMKNLEIILNMKKALVNNLLKYNREKLENRKNGRPDISKEIDFSAVKKDFLNVLKKYSNFNLYQKLFDIFCNIQKSDKFWKNSQEMIVYQAKGQNFDFPNNKFEQTKYIKQF